MEEILKIPNNVLSPEENYLYRRQMGLDGWSQSIIKNSRILIVGVGGLGCEIAKNLTRVGIGHIDLVDFDRIEYSNLSRQILYKTTDLGQYKVKIAAERLKEMNPHIEINGYNFSLENLDLSIYKAADVVIGGLDSRIARINLNRRCLHLKKPLVDGGVGGYHGYAYTNFPYENACISEISSERIFRKRAPKKRIHCVFRAYTIFSEKYKDQGEFNPKKIEHINIILNYTNFYVKKYNLFPIYSKNEIMDFFTHNPQIITTIAIISAIQSHESIKILHWLKGNKSMGIPNKTYILFNAMTWQFFHTIKKRNPNCKICGDKVNIFDFKLQEESICY